MTSRGKKMTYTIWQHSNGRWFVSAPGLGSAATSARGYETAEAAEESARELAYRRGDRHVEIVLDEPGSLAPAARRHALRHAHNPRHQSNPSGYYVWVLGRDGKPLTTEGPYGPYDYQGARSYARISATKGTHDRAVSHGKDPSSESFEIVRVYRAGTGEQKYGVAQRLGAPMAANAERAPQVEAFSGPVGIDYRVTTQGHEWERRSHDGRWECYTMGGRYEGIVPKGDDEWLEEIVREYEASPEL